jgi:hypothetical protein
LPDFYEQIWSDFSRTLPDLARTVAVSVCIEKVANNSNLTGLWFFVGPQIGIIIVVLAAAFAALITTGVRVSVKAILKNNRSNYLQIFRNTHNFGNKIPNHFLFIF